MRLCEFTSTLDTALPTSWRTIAATVPLLGEMYLKRYQTVEVLALREHRLSETAEGLAGIREKTPERLCPERELENL